MIRKIRIEDAGSIVEICRTSLGHETDPALVRARIGELASQESYFLAVYEDEATHTVLGFLQAERYSLLYGDNGWNVIALAVDPGAKRQGIGKQLLLSLEEHAKQIGYTFIRLNCNVVRKDAHAFYLSQGYVCDKTQKRFLKRVCV